MATINDIRGMDNPQRAFEYEVELLGSTVSGTKPILTQRVETVSIPEKSIETIEVNFKGRKTIYPGRDASPHTVTVNFYDDEDRNVYSFFNNWINGALDETLGGGAYRSLLAAELRIKMFKADSATLSGTHRLTKVYPTSIGEISLDYSASDHAKIAVTFSYDEHYAE
jgi:hypothetical protein